MVTVVALASIMALVIVGMTAQVITRSFMDPIVVNSTSTNQDVLDVYTRVQLYGNSIALWSMVGGIIGIIAWWFLSSQQRETVTGVY